MHVSQIKIEALYFFTCVRISSALNMALYLQITNKSLYSLQLANNLLQIVTPAPIVLQSI